eukprot:gene457-19917_t
MGGAAGARAPHRRPPAIITMMPDDATDRTPSATRAAYRPHRARAAAPRPAGHRRSVSGSGARGR